jgi:polysaccharide deacetylase 2 family uncharacterized protein YibQ
LRRKSRRDRLKSLSPTPLRTVTFLLLISALGLVLWLSNHYDPALHEPVVHLQIEPVQATHTASTAEARPADSTEDGAIDLFSDTEESSEELQATETRAAVILAPRIKLTPAPAKGFVENSSSGPLPKLSSDGRRPFDAYARPVHKGILQSSQPKIAILLGGMGLNSGLTDRAVRTLPEEITLAFAPYGTDLQQTINAARDRGHEVMLQLPMEPFGYPNLNPGPHTLLVSADSRSTAASLSWLLSRFTGYTGVVNYLGARFTSETAAMIPVVQTLKDRGLVYLEDGSSQRSVADEIAAGISLPTRRADIIIDGEPNFNAITAKLQKLEQMSRDGRIVIGIGTGLPATIDAVATWTRKLQARGILLVPVSAAFRARPG